MDQSEGLKRAATFLYYCELIFGNDWDFTKANLHPDSICPVIQPNGTLLDPDPDQPWVGGKGCNWHNLAGFLASYRELRAYLISENYYLDEFM